MRPINSSKNKINSSKNKLNGKKNCIFQPISNATLVCFRVLEQVCEF